VPLHGTTVLLTTHYLDEAQRLASRVVVLAGGRVVADASPDKLRALTQEGAVNHGYG
jgi:ABC-2 type transport system ATP-binding protein